MELQSIMLDDDSESAKRFLKAYLGKQVRAVIHSVKMGFRYWKVRGQLGPSFCRRHWPSDGSSSLNQPCQCGLMVETEVFPLRHRNSDRGLPCSL